MHLPPRRPPETPMALSVEVAGPGRRILKKSATFLPGRRRRGGVPPRSRPTMPPRRSPPQSLCLLVLRLQRRDQLPRKYERSSRRRRSTSRQRAPCQRALRRRQSQRRRSRPTMPPRRSSPQSLGLLVPRSQRRDLPLRRYERSPSRRRSTSRLRQRAPRRGRPQRRRGRPQRRCRALSPARSAVVTALALILARPERLFLSRLGP